MFSGVLLSVINNNSDSEHIRLDTILTKYNDYYVVKTKEFQQQFPYENNSNVLSAGCISITSDNYIVLGKRRSDLAVDPGKITIPSGMADNFDITKNNKVDLFGCIKREIKEEIGVNSDEIKKLTGIALFQKPKNQGMFITFFGLIDLLFSKIVRRKNDGELIELIKIDNSETVIIKILENKDYNLTSVAINSLKIYLELFSSLNDK